MFGITAHGYRTDIRGESGGSRVPIILNTRNINKARTELPRFLFMPFTTNVTGRDRRVAKETCRNLEGAGLQTLISINWCRSFNWPVDKG